MNFSSGRGPAPPLRCRAGSMSGMGPVWRLIRGQKDMCHRCGKEIVDFPAVGRVVDFQFRAEEKYCWDCYAYLTPFVDDVAPESQDPFQPVTKPAIP